MGEDEILEMMRLAFNAPKTSEGEYDWKEAQRERFLRLPVACDCFPANVTGVSISGTAIVDEPDRRVTFQMIIDVAGVDYRIARIDWRPRNPHTNKYGGPEVRGATVETSIHPFEENAELGLTLMQSGNLPIAIEIDPEPSTFNDLLLYLRDTFRLEDALDIPVPPWAPALF